MSYKFGTPKDLSEYVTYLLSDLGLDHENPQLRQIAHERLCDWVRNRLGVLLMHDESKAETVQLASCVITGNKRTA